MEQIKRNLICFMYNKFGLGPVNKDYLIKICPAKLRKPPDKSLAKDCINDLKREGCIKENPGKKSNIIKLTRIALKMYMK